MSIYEFHNFKEGDAVNVNDRFNSSENFEGIIYKIINKPENRYAKNPNWVDYFYVSFQQDVYNKLLKRGWDVIYNHREVVLGDVEKTNERISRLTIQDVSLFPTMDQEIKLKNINAILVWRVAFEIKHK
jgi:hypothetical protein